MKSIYFIKELWADRYGWLLFFCIMCVIWAPYIAYDLIRRVFL